MFFNIKLLNPYIDFKLYSEIFFKTTMVQKGKQCCLPIIPNIEEASFFKRLNGMGSFKKSPSIFEKLKNQIPL